MQSEHRDIRVSVEESLSKDVVRALREGSAPLGICWDAADLEGFETRPYRTDALSAVVHPSHPLAARETCTFEQTLAFEHVGMPAQTAVYTMLARASAILGKPDVLPGRGLVIRCIAAVCAGEPGLGHHAEGSSRCAGRLTRRGAWCRLPMHGQSVGSRSYSARRRGASPAARLLVDHLVAKAQESAPER
ncbi:LysR substrate-binding domain-containing protein [Cupriavidus basilensis]